MRIGIVGWGLEGQSAFKYFGLDHDYLIVNESAQDNFPPESDHVKVRYLADKAPIGISGQIKDLSYLEGLDTCEKIIYQPTAYFNLQKAFGNNRGFWAKATTVYDIFFEQCQSKNIVGVTGTKGKGTTSTLIAKMLQASGKTVHIGGNIGTPILDLLPDIKPDDWVVWELANFQLKTASYSPHIAVCLMITEEHQDWHPNMEDYIEAKANIFKHQKPDDIAIYFADNELSKQIAGSSPGIKIPYFAPPGAVVKDEGLIVVGDPETEVIKTEDIKLIGEHNLQNICAAVTVVWQITPDVKAIHKVLATFSGLEHRLEFVREVDGVKYYDDSFGTTPQTAIVAMRALIQPQVLILGGSDKGLEFGPMIEEAVKDRTRHVITIGQTGPKIEQMLRGRGFDKITDGLSKMTDIVAEASRVAEPGDVVLLSTGCASFGLFHDYKDRGDQFKATVAQLG